MFCTRPHPEKIESMASLLILGGVIPLSAAIIAQYGFHLAPCHFCLLQRYPYLIVIGCGALSLLVKRTGLAWRLCVAVAIFALLITGGLGLIHTAIELGALHYNGGCVAQAPADHSAAATLAAIKSAPLVACDVAALHFLGLSMAAWNSIWVVIITAAIGLQYHFDRARHAS